MNDRSRACFRRAALLCAGLVLTAISAHAQDGGPDFFRVGGLPAGQALSIHSAPEASAGVIGEIPAGTDGLKNLGCRGGLTFAEWEKATPAERESARDNRWCRIGFRDITGWVRGRFIVEGAAPGG